MSETITINGREIGKGHPTYIIAEMSANHNQDFSKAVEIINQAKAAGADAIKLQTYTPDTITLDCQNEYFQIGGDSLWAHQNLYELYERSYTPWDWQPKLKEIADNLKIDLFSSVFDSTSVDFLEEMSVPAYKVSSFEIIDIPLLQKIAVTQKPVIISTGMATLAEIEEAVTTISQLGNCQLALLKCTSAYPAPPDEMHLRTIPHLAEAFGVPTGLSDHTLGITTPVAAVALGACIIEKHFTLSRKKPGLDNAFSLEPLEFKEMVDAIRTIEKALGKISYEITEKQKAGLVFRRSLFVVKDIKHGEVFTDKNVRSIRPGYGLHTRYFDKIIGKHANKNIKCGVPMTWDLIK